MERQTLPKPNVNHWRKPTPVYYFGFLYTLCVALILYYNSTLITDLVGNQAVTPTYAIASLITIAAYFGFNKIVTLYGSYRSAIGFMSLSALALLTIGFFPTEPLLVLPALVAQLVVTSLIALNTDIFLEAESQDETTGDSRGLFLSFINTAFFLAPALGGFVATKYGIAATYWLASGISFTAGILLVTQMKAFKDPIYSSLNSFADLIMPFKQYGLAPALYLQLLLQSFYALMVIYSPLYLHQVVGLPFDTIGLIMSSVLIAFVVVEWPVGRILDRRQAKTVSTIGVTILGIAVIVLGSVPTTAPALVWAAVLLLSRIGAATVEITSEITFFKLINASNTNALEVFRVLRPLSYLIIPLVAGFSLSITSFQNIFIIAGITIISAGVYISSKLVKT
jgi:MFS family permease